MSINIDTPYRVVYRNHFDGTMRVLISGVTKEQARAVLVKFGDPGSPYHYMGSETAIEPCDGTPDGAIVAEGAPGVRA